MSSFIYAHNHSNICSGGPGAIVKKITFKKGIDFYGKISIIIIVKGIGKGWQPKSQMGSNPKTDEFKIFPLTK